jgi:hypothetical protein
LALLLLDCCRKKSKLVELGRKRELPEDKLAVHKVSDARRKTMTLTADVFVKKWPGLREQLKTVLNLTDLELDKIKHDADVSMSKPERAAGGNPTAMRVNVPGRP